jgi:hypothetical protein
MKADDFPEFWGTVLGESPEKAIQRFLDEGMLKHGDLSAQLDYTFKLTQIKEMLRERTLAVSGRKSDLIQRLVQADQEGMKQAVVRVVVLVCSERGRDIAEKFVAEEKSERTKVENQTMEYLRQRKLKEACIEVASYEAKQVFPRGMGIDFKHYNPVPDIAMLKAIFASRPKILTGLNHSQFDALQVAAGGIYLWGTNEGKKWLPPNFNTGLAMDNNAAVRMIVFLAYHRVNIEKFKESEMVREVKILGAHDSCDACKKISGKRFNLNEVIELPYEHCTYPIGCRCVILAVLD